MTPLDAIRALHAAAPHIKLRGTVEWHQRQLRDLLHATNKDIARRAAALPAKKAAAEAAKRKALDQYEAAVRRAEASIAEAKAALGPLEDAKEALAGALEGLQFFSSSSAWNNDGKIDWRAVWRAIPWTERDKAKPIALTWLEEELYGVGAPAATPKEGP